MAENRPPPWPLSAAGGVGMFFGPGASVAAELGLTLVWERLSRERRNELTFAQLTLADAVAEPPATAEAGRVLDVPAAVEPLEPHAATSIGPAATRTAITHQAGPATALRRRRLVIDSLLIVSSLPRPGRQSSPAAGDVREASGAPQLGSTGAIRHIDSAAGGRRYLRPGGHACLPNPGRAARLRGRLDTGAGHRHASAARPGGDPELRGRVHRAAAPGLRGPCHLAAKPGAPGQEPEHDRSAQPGAARGGHRHRRTPDVLRVRRGPGKLRRPVQRGAAPHAGAVDRAPRRLRRTFLAARGGRDGTQAVPEAGPAGLVRRKPSGRAPARGQATRQVLPGRIGL